MKAVRSRGSYVVAALGLSLGLLIGATNVSATGTPPSIVFHVRPPAEPLHMGQVAWFLVGDMVGNGDSKFGYDLDFKPEGAGGRPWTETTTGGPNCGGDLSPRPAYRERGGYWHLDFGDCGAMEVGIVPTKPGKHRLVIRIFLVPIRHGFLVLKKRMEETSQRYYWSGTVKK